MSCKLDICRIQWLNRELSPIYYAFKWNKSESRFIRIFETLFDEERPVQEVEIGPNQNPKKNHAANSLIIKKNGGKSQKDPNLIQIINNSDATFANHQAFDSSKNSTIGHKSSEINIIKILTQEDKRTTLMIKNIPNKFTKDNFLDIFNLKFCGKFDLFLLPTDIKEKKNYGYAFINFINYFYIIYFYHLFNGKKWANTNSVKICEIVYSKIQGITKMVKHYPIKVMYQKEIKDKSSESVEKELDENGHSSSIAIPRAYQKEFEKIYPLVKIEDDINDRDVFYVDQNKMIPGQKGD